MRSFSTSLSLSLFLQSWTQLSTELQVPTQRNHLSSRFSFLPIKSRTISVSQPSFSESLSQNLTSWLQILGFASLIQGIGSHILDFDNIRFHFTFSMSEREREKPNVFCAYAALIHEAADPCQHFVSGMCAQHSDFT